MAYAKYFCHLTILLLSFRFMAVKCSLDPADQFIDNPPDIKHDALSLHKRPSFFVGSRYGRSGSSSGSSVFATSKTRRLNVVPRNDRFFLSSRYGKRAALISEISTGTQLSSKPVPSQQQQFNDDFNTNHAPAQHLSSSSSALPPYAYMSCIYTGLQNYYRCNSIASMIDFKKPVINNNDDDENAADLFNNGHDDDADDGNDVDVNDDKK